MLKSLTKRAMLAVGARADIQVAHVSVRSREGSSERGGNFRRDLRTEYVGWGVRGILSGAGSDDEDGRALRRRPRLRSLPRAASSQSSISGCRDFRVGARLARAGLSYVGVDVVPALIAQNQSQFGGKDVVFVVRDIIRDELPPGDLCVVRQVLQHLSNDQIRAVLPKLRQYPLHHRGRAPSGARPVAAAERRQASGLRHPHRLRLRRVPRAAAVRRVAARRSWRESRCHPAGIRVSCSCLY